VQFIVFSRLCVWCVFKLNDCRRLLLTSVACFEYSPTSIQKVRLYPLKYVLSTCRLMTKPSEFRALQVLCLLAHSDVDWRCRGLFARAERSFKENICLICMQGKRALELLI